MPRLTQGAGRRGLTLPEILIAIVLLAIVGTGLTRVLVKQQQSYKDMSATAISKRELRLGASVLPAELRSISSSGGDIMAMGENEITMRAYTGTGVVCARSASGGNQVWLPPTNLARHTLTSFVIPPAVGDTVFLYNEGNDRGAFDDTWEKFAIADIATDNAACAGAPYTDPALDPPASKPRLRYTLNSALQDSVKVGAVIRFSRPVRYKIYQETSGSWYLGMQTYNGSWGVTAPMAGPYRAFQAGDNGLTGLQFRYYDTLGTRITTMTNTVGVARADVYLRAMAGTSAIRERNGATLRDSVLMRVAIRNFK
jgi:prepilin-type N-terminal cleavage/methylation domain-containing protein